MVHGPCFTHLTLTVACDLLSWVHGSLLDLLQAAVASTMEATLNWASRYVCVFPMFPGMSTIYHTATCSAFNQLGAISEWGCFDAKKLNINLQTNARSSSSKIYFQAGV